MKDMMILKRCSGLLKKVSSVKRTRAILIYLWDRLVENSRELDKKARGNEYDKTNIT